MPRCSHTFAHGTCSPCPPTTAEAADQRARHELTDASVTVRTAERRHLDDLERMEAADTLLYGARTYQMLLGYWPSQAETPTPPPPTARRGA